MQSMQAEELVRFIASEGNSPVVNVLDREQHEAKHIPGSINIPLNTPEFENKVSSHVANKDQPVVVYCASTDCDASEKAAKKLENAGFTDVRDFEAGVKGWESEGYQLEGARA